MTTKQFFLFTGIMDMFNSYYVHIVLIFSNKPSSLNDCHCGIVHQKMKQQLLKNGIKKCPLIFQGHHQQQNYENFIYYQLKLTTNTRCFVTGTLRVGSKMHAWLIFCLKLHFSLDVKLLPRFFYL